MKRKKLIIVFLLPFLLISCADFSGMGMPSDYSANLKVRAATVKIMNTSIEPSYYKPWELKDIQKSSGSGVILEGGLILTNAHVVDNSRHLYITKETDPTPYEAEIRFIGHECDLALIKPVDSAFYEGTASLPLSDSIPKLHSLVATYGYPIGGERISITEGVISRIEISSYSHSYKSAFLQIQTDAAINPGNSGGPVIQNDRVIGLAFQGSSRGDNIGYMIPTPIISHFLEDIEDGQFDGFPDLGIQYQGLENRAFRAYLGLSPEQTGVYVNKVVNYTNSSTRLKEGDVITAVEGVPVADDGSIPFEDGRIMFSYLIDSKQIGETLSMDVFRQGMIIQLEIPLKESRYPIPSFFQYEKLPRYLIYGGLIFQPLDLGYLQTWDDWWSSADLRLRYYTFYYSSDDLMDGRDEIIVLSRVLPHRINASISDYADKIVTEVNGRKIKNLDDLAEALKSPKGDFTTIKCEGTSRPLTLNHKEVTAVQNEILQTYNINRDRRMKEEWF